MSQKTLIKPSLPTKECVVCGRIFQWRKKWDRHWHEVKYCSDRCWTNRRHVFRKL